MALRLAFRLPVLFAASLALALNAQPPSGSAPGANMPGGPPPGGQGGFKPRNLKVLPPDTNLRAVMGGYSGALGVGCEFCHAAPDPTTHRSDRASDANPVKETARGMIQMTADLNTKYLAQIPGIHDADPITCGTCHRGQSHPPAFVPAPRPEGNRPPAPPPTAPPAN